MTKKKQIWVATIDTGEAKFYQYQGPDAELMLINRFSQNLPKTKDIMSDAKGRNKNQAMPGGETYAEPTDPREHEKDEFISDVATYLYEHSKQFDEIVLAAPPQALGRLREELHKNIKAKLRAEINKHLTQLTTKELAEELEGVLAFNNESIGFDDLQRKKASR